MRGAGLRRPRSRPVENHLPMEAARTLPASRKQSLREAWLARWRLPVRAAILEMSFPWRAGFQQRLRRDAEAKIKTAGPQKQRVFVSLRSHEDLPSDALPTFKNARCS